MDGKASDLLLRTGRFFRRGETSADLRTLSKEGGRSGDVFYRDRWSHDKVVRSTHGVNCTGSCRWKVYVKDGIITWETQETDYPSVGPDRPEYEPRGCPRGAAFSWYTYSPTRVRYPYVRGVLLEMYREAKARTGDPVLAWADLQADPERRRRYQQARGKGGLVRASWDEAVELAAAAHVHTIKTHGPDRIAGFSPIPAMSMVSHAAGARFHSLIGAPMLSFYDWYADLPVASPQVFGDQTDVPESGDWWDAAYLMMWGTNVPVTRTPDAHWMAEARYRGQKVVVVSPDYADNTKFADEWLHPHPGTDGALALAMGHVVLKECFVDRQVPFFTDRFGAKIMFPLVTALTIVPFLVLAVALAVMAVVEYALLTNRPDRVVPTTSLGKRLADAGRLRVTWELAALYAIGFGGIVAFGVYLPTYLKTWYGLTPTDAGTRAAGFALVTVIFRPIGGWLSDRVHPAVVTSWALGVVGAMAVCQAFEPGLVPGGTVFLLVMAAGLGTTSGSVFAMVARVTPPPQVGSVTGIVGATGGLGGFVPPLVMGAVYSAKSSYAIGFMLLSDLALAGCVYAYGRMRDADRLRTPRPVG
ncbi:MFS transporter [Streptomyces aureus]|uniref:MFS transporter n=1 Tax=Streptomyces aureus TaxID=193461 RepID=UPI0036A4A48B